MNNLRCLAKHQAKRYAERRSWENFGCRGRNGELNLRGRKSRVSSGIFLHSLTGALFVGRPHCPDSLQQLFSTLGNMKNCGHEIHPPHSSVTRRTNDRSALETERNTGSTCWHSRSKQFPITPGDDRGSRSTLKDRLSQYLLDRINTEPNVRVLTTSEVTALEGDEMLGAITVTNQLTGEKQRFNTSHVFVCIGGVPRTAWAVEVGITCDEAGYLVTGPDLLRDDPIPQGWPLDRNPYYLETSVPGVFAAGDVRHNSVKRFASAVGEGAMAVAFVHRYLAGG